MICDKCKRFHYVPGECPAPKAAPSSPEADRSSDAGGTAAGQQKSRAKASKGNAAKPARKATRSADGDASRPSDTVEVSQGAPVEAARAAIEKAEEKAAHLAPVKKRRGRPISPNPKSKRASYQRELMRRKRAKAKP